MPNGGNNGNHGLIGGKGGVQNQNAGLNGPGVAPNGGYHNNRLNGGSHELGAANNDRLMASNPGRSRLSGDGADNRAESYRGRGSMAGRHPQPHMRQRASAERHFSAGGHRR